MPPNHPLRIARERAGLTQGEAAKRMGVNEMQVSKWERGVNKPGADSLAKLADAYGVEVGALLDKHAPAAAATERGAEPDDTGERRVTMSEREYGRVIGTLETMGQWVLSLGHQTTAFADGAEAMGAQIRAMGAQSSAMGAQLRALREQLDGLGHTTADATDQLRRSGQVMTHPPEAVQEATYDALLALGRTVPRRGPDERDAAKAKKA